LRLTRDQAIVLASLGAITFLAWMYLTGMAREMADMANMVGLPDMDKMAGMALVTPYASWAPADIAVAAAMWIAMMAGMMLPSAVPMVMVYVAAERGRGGAPLRHAAAFLAGYAAIWIGFSLAAVQTQWLLLRTGLIGPDMALAGGYLGGALFIAAALYEWSPLKNRCLALCQSPLGFILGHWRPGLRGAFAMGLTHGLHCVGCCWVLMLLLFAGGVMNLLWVAALAILVLLQKVLPGARRVSLATGLLMLGAGIAILARAAGA